MNVKTGVANPYVFIIGCPRSGTTLLQRMLDAHRWLCIANDTHFIPRFIDSTADADSPLSRELIDRILGYHRFRRFKLPERSVRLIGEKSATYRQFVRALYSEFAEVHAKPFAGEKTPDYVKHIPLLHEFFPTAKFIHLIRDGRDVALSAREWAPKKVKGPARFSMWFEQPLAVCALWWNWQVAQGRLAGQPLGRDLYCEIRYEDLISNTESVLRRLTAFLGLTFDPAMLLFHKGKAKSRKRISAKAAWLPPTRGLRDWKTQMNAREIQLFEVLAGNLLDSLNYERFYSQFSDEMADLAVQCNQEWSNELMRRNKIFIHSNEAKK